MSAFISLSTELLMSSVQSAKQQSDICSFIACASTLDDIKLQTCHYRTAKSTDSNKYDMYNTAYS